MTWTVASSPLPQADQKCLQTGRMVVSTEWMKKFHTDKAHPIALYLLSIPNGTTMTCDAQTFTTNYAIFSTQHSGTTWTSSVLGSHPMVGSLHELFCCKALGHKTIAMSSFYRGICLRQQSLEAGTWSSKCFTNGSFSMSRGFVVQSTQGWVSELQSWISFLRKEKVRVVLLERLNLLELALAESAKKKNNHPTSKQPTKTLTVSDVKSLMQSSRTNLHKVYQKTKMVLIREGIPVHHISYEALAGDAVNEFFRLFYFVGQTKMRLRNGVIVDVGANWTYEDNAGSTTHHTGTVEERLGSQKAIKIKKFLEKEYPQYVCFMDGTCDWPSLLKN
eukprot:CAMPEP_0119127436 /NCGR_PEP_ID=MMETSP1310-20130426/5991_1 /TAXON_ID=464262 /ORGANISM="Genus nov. species nov., Strain RCC2339" /LENGTH=332 /DNA_ID=CAMNT_0007117695 /DNA_START=199 /DNA_END=1197 /DNA_ORIENTATION=-